MKKIILSLPLFLILFSCLFYAALKKDYDLAPYDLIEKVNSADFNNYMVKNPLLDDAARQFIPWDIYIKKSLNNRTLPLWNPYNSCGEPFFSNYQSAIFYPISYLTMNFKHPYLLKAFLKLLICFIGMFLFLSELKFSSYASLLGSILFTFCGFNMLWLCHPHSNVSVFMPFLFYYWRKFMYEDNLCYLIIFILFASIQFLGGHPETSFQIAISLFIFFIFFHNKENINVKYFKNIFLYMPLAFIIAIFLCAFQIFPFLNYLMESTTLLIRPIIEEIGINYFGKQINELYSVISFFTPLIFGTPLLNNWKGPINFNEINSGFIGLSPLLFVLIALFNLKDKKIFPFIIILFFSVIFIYKNLFSDLFIKFFPFNVIDFKRMLLTVAFSLSALAAYGFDYYLAHEFKKPQKVLLIFITILFSIFYFLFIQINENLIEKTMLSKTIGYNFLPFIIIFLFIFFTKSKRKNIFGIFFVILFELYLCWNGYIPSLKKSDSEIFSKLEEKLKNDKSLFRIFSDGSLISPNTNLPHEIFLLKGYDAIGKKDYFHFLQSLNPFPINPVIHLLNFFPNYSAPFLNFLNVKYIISSNKQLSEKNKNLVFFDSFKIKNHEIYIFENKNCLPRFYSVQKIIGADDYNALELLKLNSFDWTLAAVANLKNNYEFPSSNKTIINVIKYSSNEIKLFIKNLNPIMLIMSETYDKDFYAFLNDKPVNIIKANYSFRGIIIDSIGEHYLILKYKPLSFKIGIIISILTFIILIFSLLIKRFFFLKYRDI